MTEANEFLDNLDNGYSELKQHEMISLPKIRLQSIMQEYATRQLDFQKGMFSPIIDYLKKQISWKQKSLESMDKRHKIPKQVKSEIEDLKIMIAIITDFDNNTKQM